VLVVVAILIIIDLSRPRELELITKKKIKKINDNRSKNMTLLPPATIPQHYSWKDCVTKGQEKVNLFFIFRVFRNFKPLITICYLF